MDEEKKDSLIEENPSESTEETSEIDINEHNTEELSAVPEGEEPLPGSDREATLSEETSIDQLLYDSDAVMIKTEEETSREDYDSFLSDFKETMARTLQLAKEQKEEAEHPKAEPGGEESPSTGGMIAELSELMPEESDQAQQPVSTPHKHLTIQDIEDGGEGGEQLMLDLGDGLAGSEIQSDTEPAEESEPEGPPKRNNGLHLFFELVELFVFTLVAVMLLTTFVLRHSKVDGGSMMNTLHNGDHLIISDLFYTPDYDDIVVFHSAEADGKALVKRIVALEGDTVDFYFAEGRYLLYVNGELVEKDYAYVGGEGHVLSEVRGYVVKPGEVFVLGDHRNDSHDSRSFGAIDTDTILGRVILRFYPFESFGKVE